MARYNVWWTTGRADGDSSYDDLADAESRFEDVIQRPDIVEAIITDEEAGWGHPDFTVRHYLHDLEATC